jgi:transposase
VEFACSLAPACRRFSRHERWQWLIHQPGSELSLWYEKRFGKGSPCVRKTGIVALARKLLIALWRYLEIGETPKGAVLKTVSV